MKRITKPFSLFLRFITVPPVVTGITVILLHYPAGAISLTECLISLLFLTVFPLLAYPVSELLGDAKTRRERQRAAALVFSVIGYAGGLTWALLASASKTIVLVFFTYVFSSVVLILLNKLGFAASGHACSTTAPTVFLTWQLGWMALPPCFALIAIVYSSSIRLKRHTVCQLLAGSVISLISGLVSIPLFR